MKIENARANIGKIITEGLEKKRMTQTELAEKVGLDKTAINHYIKNERVPKCDALIAICDVLEIDLNSFVKGKLYKSSDLQSIGEYSEEILQAIAILIKSKYIVYNEQYGWGYNSNYKAVDEFSREIKNFSDSKYKNIKNILSDLIDTYSIQLEKEIDDELARENSDVDLPF